MEIIINDFIQNSDAPKLLKSYELADYYSTTGTIIINLDSVKTFDAIGIGKFDGTNITINGQNVTYTENGLYKINSITAQRLEITHNGTLIGRLAVGVCRFLGSAPAREVGFFTTEKVRNTLSGQRTKSAGGYSGRRIDLDFRYKIDRDMYSDMMEAHRTQLAKGIPFFLSFDKEYNNGQGRMPYERMYAVTDNNVIFQSSINFFKYSRKFSFREAF